MYVCPVCAPRCVYHVDNHISKTPVSEKKPKKVRPTSGKKTPGAVVIGSGVAALTVVCPPVGGALLFKKAGELAVQASGPGRTARTLRNNAYMNIPVPPAKGKQDGTTPAKSPERTSASLQLPQTNFFFLPEELDFHDVPETSDTPTLLRQQSHLEQSQAALQRQESDSRPAVSIRDFVKDKLTGETTNHVNAQLAAHLGAEYVVVDTVVQLQMRLLVYVRRVHLNAVVNIAHSHENTGFGKHNRKI